MDLFGIIQRWRRTGTRCIRAKTIHRPRLEFLEDRRLLACVSDDPFICTPLPPTHSGLAIHIHPTLKIIVNGQDQTVPANVGIVLDSNGNPQNFYPLHTHDASGTIHVESPTVRDFHLKDFFAIWDQKFDSTHILGYSTAANNPVQMTVNGVPSPAYGDLKLNDGAQIVITASNATLGEQPPVKTPYDGKLFVVGDATGKVEVRRVTDGTIQAEFQAYGTSYQGPISVAIGDVNGDGFEDIVTGPTRASAHVKVFDGKPISNATFQESNPDAHLLASWMAYEPRFGVGVHVAVGKIANAGGTISDIITGASVGNPHVKVYKGQAIKDGTFGQNPENYLLASFFAYALNKNYGATVAAGNISASDHDDLVCGTTVGNPHVKIYKGEDIGHSTFNNFNPDASLMTGFFAFDTGRNLGAFVSVGDTNDDGFADVLCGSFANSSEVKVYDGKKLSEGTNAGSTIIEDFFAYDTQFATGVTVGAGDFNNDGKADILTGATQGSAHYRAVSADSASGVKPPALLENVASELSTIIFVDV